MNKNIIKKWRLRDYLLQFIVVVAGILVTFQGSAWIEKNSRRKQAREVLSLVSTELRGNLQELEFCLNLGETELKGMEFFTSYMDDIKKAPRDSVDMYISVLGSGHEFPHSSNALEVMKTSPAAISMIDKELLRDVFYCYDRIEVLLKSVNYYYTQKYDIVSEFYFSLDKNTIRMLQNGENNNLFLEKYLNNPKTVNWALNTRENFSPRVWDVERLIAIYGETIKEIGKFTKRGKQQE